MKDKWENVRKAIHLSCCYYSGCLLCQSCVPFYSSETTSWKPCLLTILPSTFLPIQDFKWSIAATNDYISHGRSWMSVPERSCSIPLLPLLRQWETPLKVTPQSSQWVSTSWGAPRSTVPSLDHNLGARVLVLDELCCLHCASHLTGFSFATS